MISTREPVKFDRIGEGIVIQFMKKVTQFTLSGCKQVTINCQ